MRPSACLMVLFLVCFSFICVQPLEATEILALLHGRIIDGTGAAAIPDGVVIIENNRISAVGPWKDVEVPSEARVIDVKGKTILPGIVDSHVHSTAAPQVRRTFLEAGTTTVCDLGSPIDSMPEFLKPLDGENPAARGFRAGPIITVPGGLPDAVLKTNLNFKVSTPMEARTGVTHLVSLGADVIKIYLEPSDAFGMLDLEQVKAIVKEAHARSRLVRAHVSKLAAVDIAIEGGVDVIEHVPLPRLENDELQKKLAGSTDPYKDLYNLVLVPEYETVLPRMVEKKIILVPTLTRGMGRFHEDPRASEGQRVIARAVLEIVKRFHDLGGVIALGSDYYPEMPGAAGMMHLREFELLRAAGLTPMQVIETCTRHAAEACGREKELGFLKEAMLADLIVVDGDPLADLKVLAKIVLVIKDGAVAYEAG